MMPCPQGKSRIGNLKRGEFGVVETNSGFVLDKRRDPANGLAYYVVYDEEKTRVWSDENTPWDFRKAVRIFKALVERKRPSAREQKFSFL